ncbi:MAG: orotate phosphoribosyltransferase [Candidatus Bathyarchaeota archaeon]|nr:orotate phosphoribosyltransferase [Candidatus Bathyarchaeota archaeon]
MSDIAFKVAFALYNSGCLKFGTFKIKSGALSPYYIDLACLLSSPKELSTVVDMAAEKINGIMKIEKIDKLASIELKGALILPSIACKVNLPCTIVRKEDKTYGVTGRIAGADVIRGESLLFFDDVVTEGLSKLEGIKALEIHGAHVKNVMVVVDREEGGKENLEKLGYKVHALVKVSELVEILFKSEHIPKEQRDAVLNYIKKTPELVH